MTIKLLMFTLMLFCANAFAASQWVPESVAWGGYPSNQSANPKFACLVTFIGYGPGLGAECIGTAVCTPGSFFSRTQINTSSAVMEFCSQTTMPIELSARGAMNGNRGIESTALLTFPKLGFRAGARYSVVHESDDDCNQAMRYDSAPMTKPCPQPI